MIDHQNDLVEVWQSIIAYHDAETQANQWVDPATIALFLVLLLYSSLLASDHPSLAVFACAFFAGAFTAYLPRHQSINANVYMDIKPKRNIEIQPRSKKTENATELHLSDPTLTEKTTQLINYTLRDFVSIWWGPMNFYGNKEFEDEIRVTINATVEALERSIQAHDSNDLLLAMLYGVANSLIIHMREYREFEDSQLDLHEFTRRNPSSPFSQLLSRDEQHQQLRELGYSFIQKMVPKEDLTSPIVAAFFKEVFASYALESALSLLCDPDYLNLCIVDVLNDAVEGSDEINGADNDLSHLEGFRSVVEKAAEDAMATKNESVGSIKVAETKPKNRPVEVEGRISRTIPKDDDQLVVRTSTSSSTLNEGSPTDGLYPQDSPKSANGEQKWTSNRNSIDSTKTSSLRSSTTLQPSSPVIKEQLPMLFEKGTASFSIMDISPNDAGEKIDSAALLYFVQIERSASNEKRQSEGGGYILTRTYDNFVTLHSVLSARHPKVVSKLSLKLPLDQGRSWRSSRAQQNNRDAICQSLERYLHTVTDNEILGHEKSVHVFFRKEQSTNEDIDTIDTMSNQPAPEEESVVSKARNYFSGSSASLNSEDDREAVTSQQMSPRSQYSRWINKKAQRPSSLKDLGENEGPTSRQQASENVAVTKMTAMEATLVTKEDEQSTGVKHSDGSSTPQDNQKAQNTHKKLNSIEVELLIETTFALITEIFQLTEANQNAWLRRTALNLLREVIRRSYAEVISQQFVKYMEEYARTSYFTTLVGSITESFWPKGEWATSVALRTPEEKAATKTLARELLKTRGVPSGARQLIGEVNCVDAMERLWSRCQDVDLNRVLGVQILERTLRPLVN
ncbi:hypothetical protein INT44_008226 [Umbelopsis vinacea]|uniref:PXA domain-containing protein n=1 Tax=Umbelopsis vinacea TaxID=44442 RepID=A0A8H7UDM5_9FUNG|nr:hypothetical protein INT44_008226 [Umbelopsis vinacea]